MEKKSSHYDRIYTLSLAAQIMCIKKEKKKIDHIIVPMVKLNLNTLQLIHKYEKKLMISKCGDKKKLNVFLTYAFTHIS